MIIIVTIIMTHSYYNDNNDNIGVCKIIIVTVMTEGKDRNVTHCDSDCDDRWTDRNSNYNNNSHTVMGKSAVIMISVIRVKVRTGVTVTVVIAALIE